jgi:hypothetical protein
MGDGFYQEQPVPQDDWVRVRPLPVVYGPAIIDRMGGSIDGGWSGAGDTSQEWPERTDSPEYEEQARYARLLASLELPSSIDPDPWAVLEPEGADVSDQSSDLLAELHPEDQSPLSESERQSVTGFR